MAVPTTTNLLLPPSRFLNPHLTLLISYHIISSSSKNNKHSAFYRERERERERVCDSHKEERERERESVCVSDVAVLPLCRWTHQRGTRSTLPSPNSRFTSPSLFPILHFSAVLSSSISSLLPFSWPFQPASFLGF